MKRVIACSGGIDSVVLAYYLNTVGLIDEIFHYVYEEPAEFSKLALNCVTELSSRLDLPLVVIKESDNTTTDKSNNKELDWRNKRYHALSQMYTEEDVIYLGHHMDDQLTSYILHLLKDSARCFIPPITKYNHLNIIRPYCLWMINKGEIERLRELFELDYVEDPMNTVGDRATVDLVLPDLKQIKQLLPIFNKKYQQYVDKMDFLNKEEVQQLLTLR